MFRLNGKGIIGSMLRKGSGREDSFWFWEVIAPALDFSAMENLFIQ